jgi:type I restriction enzyme M protein
MARKTKYQTAENASGARLGFEETLWAAADKMRSYMDPAEYKHVVLGLIFLMDISDTFEEMHEQLKLWSADPSNDWYVKDPEDRYMVIEDRDEYLAENIFWMPPKACWNRLQANAKQPEIGRLMDGAIVAIERENPSCKGRASQGLLAPLARQALPRKADGPDRRGGHVGRARD